MTTEIRKVATVKVAMVKVHFQKIQFYACWRSEKPHRRKSLAIRMAAVAVVFVKLGDACWLEYPVSG